MIFIKFTYLYYQVIIPIILDAKNMGNCQDAGVGLCNDFEEEPGIAGFIPEVFTEC